MQLPLPFSYLLHLSALLPCLAQILFKLKFSLQFCCSLTFLFIQIHTIFSESPSCSCDGFLCNGYVRHRAKNSDTVFHNMLCYNSLLSQRQLLFAQHSIIDRETTFRYSIRMQQCQGSLHHIWQICIGLLRNTQSIWHFWDFLPVSRHHQTFQSQSKDHPGCHHTYTAAILLELGHRNHWFLLLSSGANTDGSLLICLCSLICFLAAGMTGKMMANIRTFVLND